MEAIGKLIAGYFEWIIPLLQVFMPMELAVAVAVLVPVITFLVVASDRLLRLIFIAIVVAWLIFHVLPAALVMF